MMNKKAQVWIETVIYTLIGLSLIGLVLAIVTPQINELSDRAVIDQTIDSLNSIDSKIDEVLSAPGNVRVVSFNMRRGEMRVDSEENTIEYVIDDSRVIYSEPDVPITLGEIEALTTEGQKRHIISLKISYPYNLTIEGSDTERVFSAASIPYRFSIENRGSQDGEINIHISEITQG